MIENVVASLTGFPSDAAVLNTSVQVATEFSAHVDCVHVSLGGLDANTAIATETSFLHARAIEQLRAIEGRIAAQAGDARAAFNAAGLAEALVHYLRWHDIFAR